MTEEVETIAKNPSETTYDPTLQWNAIDAHEKNSTSSIVIESKPDASYCTLKHFRECANSSRFDLGQLRM